MAKPRIATLVLLLGFSACSTLRSPFHLLGCRATLAPAARLSPSVAYDDGLFPDGRTALLRALDSSLSWLETPAAEDAYRQSAASGVRKEEVVRSLKRFREIAVAANGPEELQAQVRREFSFYRPTRRRKSGILVTGYCEPIFNASRLPSGPYRFPLYRSPGDFAAWPSPHPTRQALEGADGLSGRLRGWELAYLDNRLDAALIQIQGSATLVFADGGRMTVGYDGATKYPFTSIAMELVRDGRLTKEEASWRGLREYFRAHPEELDRYVPRNNRFVFFRDTGNRAPLGSLGVPVVPMRSIATDKSLMPPAALAVTVFDAPGDDGFRQLSRFVLDHDTGSAITGPGRVDVFVGSGPEACESAGNIRSRGALFYLLLREEA